MLLKTGVGVYIPDVPALVKSTGTWRCALLYCPPLWRVQAPDDVRYYTTRPCEEYRLGTWRCALLYCPPLWKVQSPDDARYYTARPCEEYRHLTMCVSVHPFKTYRHLTMCVTILPALVKGTGTWRCTQRLCPAHLTIITTQLQPVRDAWCLLSTFRRASKTHHSPSATVFIE